MMQSFWRTGTYRAVRSGDWKLQLSDPDGTAFLFNLKVDPTEENNLSGSEPGELDRLKRLIETEMGEWSLHCVLHLSRVPNILIST